MIMVNDTKYNNNNNNINYVKKIDKRYNKTKLKKKVLKVLYLSKTNVKHTTANYGS